jgi:hypothetical protein
MTITPANAQDTIDAPPAEVAAVKAPNSHPEPIIEPRETKVTVIKPTSRRKLLRPPCTLLDMKRCAMITSILSTGNPVNEFVRFAARD